MSQGSDLDDVRELAGRRVLVVGDLVLDEYVTGRMTRISREAPVPILEVDARDFRAGSAASVAANVIGLGSYASIVGAIGCDPAATRLEACLCDVGVADDGLVRTPELTTPTKTRYLAQGFTGGLGGRQQVMRVDDTTLLPAAAIEACAQRVGKLAGEFDAVLLSDYRGGVVSQASIDAARASGRPIAVDSQGDLRRFRSLDLIKVNQAEAQSALGSSDVVGQGAELRRELDARVLVITLGSEGMLVFDGSDAAPLRVPAVRVSQVFDVTGAGDTVIATYTAALAAGADPESAARLANYAGGIVVMKRGTATVTRAELLRAVMEG